MNSAYARDGCISRVCTKIAHHGSQCGKAPKTPTADPANENPTASCLLKARHLPRNKTFFDILRISKSSSTSVGQSQPLIFTSKPPTSVPPNPPHHRSPGANLRCPAEGVGPMDAVAVRDAGQAVEVILKDQVPHREPHGGSAQLLG